MRKKNGCVFADPFQKVPNRTVAAKNLRKHLRTLSGNLGVQNSVIAWWAKIGYVLQIHKGRDNRASTR
jgi:hypothetical protein